MAERILVKVSGCDSPEALEDLRFDLAAGTGLTWKAEPPAEDPQALSVMDTVYSAVIDASAAMAVPYVVGKAKEALRRFTADHADPPETSVETEPLDTPGPDEG